MAKRKLDKLSEWDLDESDYPYFKYNKKKRQVTIHFGSNDKEVMSLEYAKHYCIMLTRNLFEI